MFGAKNQYLLRKTNIFQCSHCWAKTPAEQVFQVFQVFLSKHWISDLNPNHTLTQIDVLGQSMSVVDSLQATSLIVYSLYSMVYSLQSILYGLQSIVYSVQSVVSGLQSVAYSRMLHHIACSTSSQHIAFRTQYLNVYYIMWSITYILCNMV